MVPGKGHSRWAGWTRLHQAGLPLPSAASQHPPGGLHPSDRSPMLSARACELHPQFQEIKPFCWWTTTHPSHLFRLYATKENPKIITNILEPPGISTEPKEDEGWVLCKEDAAASSRHSQPAAVWPQMLFAVLKWPKGSPSAVSPPTAAIPVQGAAFLRLWWTPRGVLPPALSTLPWAVSAPHHSRRPQLEHQPNYMMFHSFWKKKVTASLCVRKHTSVEGSFCSCSLLLSARPTRQRSWFLCYLGKKSREIYSQQAKQKEKKANTRQRLNLVFFWCLSDASTYELQWSWECLPLCRSKTSAVVEPAAPSVPLCPWLRDQKTASSFTGTDTAIRLCQWPGSGKMCLVQCFASWVDASQTEASLSVLHSNPAPCICTRSSPGWRAEVAPNPARCSSPPAANPFQENSSPVYFKVGPRKWGWTQVSLQLR